MVDIYENGVYESKFYSDYNEMKQDSPYVNYLSK